jgi:hypothetical protein
MTTIVIKEATAWIPIATFARWVSGKVSVGLKAVEFVRAMKR